MGGGGGVMGVSPEKVPANPKWPGFGKGTWGGGIGDLGGGGGGVNKEGDYR
jgi:hypothetical protein